MSKAPMLKSFVLLCCLIAVSSVAQAADGLIVKQSAHGVSDTLDRMVDILNGKGIRVFARVDHQANAKTVDLSLRPTQVLIFGNPKLGTPLMNAQQSVGIDLPMKVVAWEDEKGQVWLGYNDPAYMTKRHGITDRDEVAMKMAKALEAMTDKAVAP